MAGVASASRKSPRPSSGSQQSASPQNSQVASVRLQFRGKAEIIVPAEEFEPSAELYERQKFLRKKYLGENPPVDDHGLSIVIYGEGQTFVIGLRHRIGEFGAVAGTHRHPAFAPGPAAFVVVENPKPDKAIQ